MMRLGIMWIRDFESAVLFLCSPLSKMITGRCTEVDGGSGEAS